MRHFLEELAEWNHGFGGFERLEVSGVLVGWVGSWIGGTWHFDAFWISCSQEIHRAGLSVRGRQVTAWDQWRMPGATGQAAFATRAVGRDGCFTTWLGGNLGKLKRCFYFCLRCENGKGNFTLMDANSYVVFMTNSDKSVSKLTHLLVAFPLNSSSKCTRSSACRSCSISEPQNKTHSHHSHKTWIQYNPMNKKKIEKIWTSHWGALIFVISNLSRSQVSSAGSSFEASRPARPARKSGWDWENLWGKRGKGRFITVDYNYNL